MQLLEMPAGPAPLVGRDLGHPCIPPHTSSSAAFRGVLLLLLRPLPPLCSHFPISDLRVHHGPICPPRTTSPPLPRPVARQLSLLRLWLPKVSSGRPGPAHCQGIRVQLVILATHLHFSRWVQKVEPGSSPPWRRHNLCRTTPLSKGAMPSPQASHSQ